jgi:hypothetical protein
VANEQQPGKPLSAKGAARRRFTRAGAAASGVLLTLYSQPGMAQVVCATPSGAASALASARNPDAETCSGRSPGVWLQALSPRGNSGKGGGNTPGHTDWPVSPDKLFGEWFTTSRPIGKAKLKEVLANTDPSFDPENLGMHLVAAMLNVLSGRSTFQTENMLVDMWNRLRDDRVYHPTAGIDWTAYDVVQYLRSTMI